MKNLIGLSVALVFTGLLASAGEVQDDETRHRVGSMTGSLPAGVKDSLQSLVDAASADPEIPGALLAVVGSAGLDWVGAAGVAEVAGGTPLRPDAPVRLASNTKTYVAASVLRLVEEGLIELDEPIASLLAEDVVDLLTADGYAVDRITIRHLLTHSSGLADHAVTDQFTTLVFTHPQRRWTRREQIEGLVQWADPLAPAGERFSYSDTGYLLLGSIIERVADRPLAAAVRDLLDFRRLGLEATWWEHVEPRPAGLPDRAHQYAGTVDIHSWDPSYDLYGGGGLVATVEDLARFWDALFRGEVFASPKTLPIVLTTPLESGTYRMALWVHRLEDWTLYEHAGHWGTRAGFVPELDLALAAVVTQQVGGEERALELIVDAARVLRRWKPRDGSQSTAEGD